jgi:hypothetical protein
VILKFDLIWFIYLAYSCCLVSIVLELWSILLLKRSNVNLLLHSTHISNSNHAIHDSIGYYDSHSTPSLEHHKIHHEWILKLIRLLLLLLLLSSFLIALSRWLLLWWSWHF